MKSVFWELHNKLNKIIWFNSKEESFDYYIVRGSKQKLLMNTEDLMILQYLLIKLCEENEYTNWEFIINSKNFMSDVKRGMSWANDKQRALIFKYKPSDEVIEANRKFEECKRKYLLKRDDVSYNEMYKAFEKFYNIL
jgi:hypothetical protein